MDAPVAEGELLAIAAQIFAALVDGEEGRLVPWPAPQPEPEHDDREPQDRIDLPAKRRALAPARDPGAEERDHGDGNCQQLLHTRLLMWW